MPKFVLPLPLAAIKSVSLTLEVLVGSVLEQLLLPWRKLDITSVWEWPVLRALNLFGWWAEDISNPVVRILLKVVRLVFFAVNAVYMISVTVGVWHQLGRSPNIMDNLFPVVAAAPSYLAGAKLGSILYQKNTLKGICKNLDGMLSDVVQKGIDAQLERELRSRYKRCWIMCTSFLTVGSCITLHWLLRPLVYASYGMRTSIVDTWPSYFGTWSQWTATYIFQAMNISSLGHALYIYDNVYFCICENVLIQFAILKHKMYELDISKESSDKVTLRFCVNQHTKLINICMKLRESSQGLIFQQIFWTVGILCPGVFELASGRVTDATILFNITELLSIMTLIIFLYSWYSNEVTYQFSEVYNYCYMSNWERGNPTQRKTILTMMTRSMKPLELGRLVKLNLSTFITVLKTTFSYYQFLDTMDKNRKTN